jgi:mono/diheme cytochrome c family protein
MVSTLPELFMPQVEIESLPASPPMRIPLAFLLGWIVTAEARADAPVEYVKDIKPLFARHCVSCHGATKPRAGLRLDTAAAILRGNKNGSAIIPGHSEESALIDALLGEGAGERMPLKRPPLSEREIATLRGWIDQGARAPADEVPSVPAPHWAFVAPKCPEIPAVSRPSWVRNPIDAFVLARLDRESPPVTPSPDADRATLARRVSLDLTGLLPSPEEVEAFLKDESADAYERLVDRLLASPHYGERWARPWLDLARYADSNGYSIDAPRSIWPYRDWVIAALNRDLPFDEFTIDQLAGDLRPEATLEQKVATGFHRNTPINQEGGIDVEQFRVESVIDRVGTTATVWLGLTIACAQCHDHKYDPISQKEYYQLFAFFNSVDEPDLELADADRLARRNAARARLDLFHKRLKAEHPELADRERAWESTLSQEFKVNQSPEIKNAFDIPIEKRSENQWRGLMELFLAQDEASGDLGAALAAIRREMPTISTTMVVRERPRARPTHLLLGGDFTRPAEPVEPGVPAVLSPLDPCSASPTRMDLARWLVDPANPLTARVTMNRVWQAYFGRGVVETENDFGAQGAEPSHPELLDWLATEFIARGWSLKAMHRLIVTSATYRQSSHARPDLAVSDPNNRLLARQSRLRLDAEAIRDAALAASGLLTRTIGGPGVFPPQPDGVMTLGQMRRPWVASTGADRYRRGLYTYFWRATPHPALTVFDAPNGTQSCTRRVRSNTPLQALTLLNDPAFFELAEALATRILAESPEDDEARVRRAFALVLGRSPSPKESRRLRDLLDQERADARQAPCPCAADEAAWTTAARVLLNLDEFITRE